MTTPEPLFGELGPIGLAERPVDDVIRWVHRTACVPQQHDEYCNTLRRIEQDRLGALDREKWLRDRLQLVSRRARVVVTVCDAAL